MRMQVDAFGKIEVAQNVRILEVKMDRDLSEVVYDHFQQNRKRFGGNRDNRDNHHGGDNRSFNQFSMNDTQSVNTFLSSQIGINK